MRSHVGQDKGDRIHDTETRSLSVYLYIGLRTQELQESVPSIVHNIAPTIVFRQLKTARFP